MKTTLGYWDYDYDYDKDTRAVLESRGWGGGRDGKAEPDNSHRIDPHTFDYHITITITITITRARQES